MKEERKVSFAQAVTGLDNLVLFCQQQDLSVDIQLYSQLKQLRKRIVGKSIAAKKQTCLEDFINFEIQQRNRMERTEVNKSVLPIYNAWLPL